MRLFRMYLVQTEAQYIFIHQIVFDWLNGLYDQVDEPIYQNTNGAVEEPVYENTSFHVQLSKKLSNKSDQYNGHVNLAMHPSDSSNSRNDVTMNSKAVNTVV